MNSKYHTGRYQNLEHNLLSAWNLPLPFPGTSPVGPVLVTGAPSFWRLWYDVLLLWRDSERLSARSRTIFFDRLSIVPSVSSSLSRWRKTCNDNQTRKKIQNQCQKVITLLWSLKIIHLYVYWDPWQHSYYDKATDGMTKRLEFFSWKGQEIFFFSKISRPVLWPTQLAIQWVSGAPVTLLISKYLQQVIHIYVTNCILQHIYNCVFILFINFVLSLF